MQILCSQGIRDALKVMHEYGDNEIANNPMCDCGDSELSYKLPTHNRKGHWDISSNSCSWCYDMGCEYD